MSRMTGAGVDSVDNQHQPTNRQQLTNHQQSTNQFYTLHTEVAGVVSWSKSWRSDGEVLPHGVVVLELLRVCSSC